MKKIFFYTLAIIFIIGYLIPEGFKMPVEGAYKGSYNPETFWYYPWGTSVTHKGADIFAKKGTIIHSATIGVAVKLPELGKGGKCVLVLGPKWRFHYYAHMNSVDIGTIAIVGHNTKLGTVGNSGNAGKTPAHLHYSIATILPYPWRIDNSPQGWKKMFYLNPVERMNEYFD